MEDLLIQRLNRPINGNRSAVANEAKAVFATSLGLVRKENEDRAIVARFFSHKFNSYIHCYILSDGMGGMANGGLAATLTVAHFLTKLAENIDSNGSIENSIKSAVLEAHKKVCEVINFKGGATLSAIVSFKPGELYTVNIGDSRIYQCTSGQSILQITEDDDIKSFLRKLKGIEVNDILAQRNGLTKFIGMEGDLEFEVEFCNSTSDFFIISDGISLIGEENLSNLYENRTNNNEFLQRCILLSNWLGGKDNATGIYINLSEMGTLASSDSSTANFIEVWDFHGNLLFPKPSYAEPQDEEKPSGKKSSKKTSKKNKTSSLKSEANSETVEVEIESVQKQLFTSDDEINDEASKHSKVSIEPSRLEKK